MKLQKLLAFSLITFLGKVGSGKQSKAEQRATHDLNMKRKEEPRTSVTLSLQKPNSRLGSEPEGKCLDGSWLTHTLYARYGAKAAQRIPRSLISTQEMILLKSSRIGQRIYQARTRCLSECSHGTELQGDSQIRVPQRAAVNHFAQVIWGSTLYCRKVWYLKKKAQSFARGPCGACIPKSENVELHLWDVPVSVLLNLELASVNIHLLYLSLSLAATGYQIFAPCS